MNKLLLGVLSIVIAAIVMSEITSLRPQHLQNLLGSVERITSALDTTYYLNHTAVTAFVGEDDEYSDVCIGIISLNGFGTNDHGLLQRLVRSIRTTGQWPRGRILIVTDDILRNDTAFQHFVDSDGNILVEYVSQQSLQDIQDLIPPQPTSKKLSKKDKKNMAAKRFKTDLLALMANHTFSNTTTSQNPNFMLYIDSDVVIGEPLQLFFDAMRSSFSSDMHVSSRMFLFEEIQSNQTSRLYRRHPTTLNFHGGLLALHQEQSKGCLQVWQEQFDSHRYDRDQEALWDILYNNDLNLSSRCQVLPLNNSDFLLMPTETTMMQNETRTFIHFTSGRRKRIDEALQSRYFRDILHLEEA